LRRCGRSWFRTAARGRTSVGIAALWLHCIYYNGILTIAASTIYKQHPDYSGIYYDGILTTVASTTAAS
jgi:hypothetical protein